MMRILFDPYDVLFFRDGRPFEAGDSHLGRSVTYIPQTTVTGAIRSLLYNLDSLKYRNLIKVGEEEPGFTVKGSFFYRGEELFHLPLDVARGENGLGILKLEATIKNYRPVTLEESLHFSRASGFLGLEGMKEYLRGRFDEDYVVNPPDVFLLEDRIGVGLDTSRTAKMGLLYRTRNLRPVKDVKISVWIDDGKSNGLRDIENDLAKAVATRLGGEGHFSFVKVENHKPWSKLNEELKKELGDKDNGIVKLYVATPLILSENNETGTVYTWDVSVALKELDVKAEIVKTFLGKPIRVEGWDFVRRRPKKPRFAVPPGSVYYLKIREGTENLNPVMKLGELQKLGFGLVFTGKVEGD
ncbi:type III-B CRISPR module-associated protein Cmr3 [Thermococcus sp. MAR1]|uniref:type III-B CRISPR module-associated protein Cmr3 n=1 Tax=Thermococcus sp. MAR1 TaxID=1638263 RepID=UPI00143A8776|nr:type III-B CRISPR module-associated protein Cmr3 [Thermococcus sp. MAR1]NJE10070.1 type III-B CRISPR module-associated protein Cmr3 [Thermococcus sp. MAR1]